ncbi:hypothetical protein [Draconibacterium sp.]|uniref:hypothetical protein n=1 Tax=Draconibacterium sp. TaxID=1965318 RepID=UPI003563B5FD
MIPYIFRYLQLPDRVYDQRVGYVQLNDNIFGLIWTNLIANDVQFVKICPPIIVSNKQLKQIYPPISANLKEFIQIVQPISANDDIFNQLFLVLYILKVLIEKGYDLVFLKNTTWFTKKSFGTTINNFIHSPGMFHKWNNPRDLKTKDYAF